MALSGTDPPPEDVSLYLYCRAAARQEQAELRRIRQHLLERLQLEDELRRVLQREQREQRDQ